MLFPSVYNFPIHLHTCFLIYIDENIHYYAINLSWSNVQFWLPTILIFFCSVCNGWQPNWKPLTTHAFFWMENSYAREVYVINYSFPLSVPKWRLLCLLSFKYFSTHGKNVYEQLTVYGVGGSLFSVLWNDFMSKRNMFLLLYQQHNPFHLELNLKHRVFHLGCGVWRLGNISWGISLEIPQFLVRGYSVMWWVKTNCR